MIPPSPLPILAYAPSRMVAGRTIVFTFRISTPEFDQTTFTVVDLPQHVRGVEFCKKTYDHGQQPLPQSKYSQKWGLEIIKHTCDGATLTHLIERGKFSGDVQVVTVEKAVPENAHSIDLVLTTHNGVITIADIPIHKK